MKEEILTTSFMSKNNKKVELTWPNKETEVKKVSLPFQTVEVLNKPRVTQGRLGMGEKFPDDYPKDWKNKLIWGDNKPIISSLLKQGFAGQIDLIYIDPPFATGSDFSVDIEVGDETVTKKPSVIEELAYRDTWGQGLNSYLTMLYDRLVLMKEILAEDGAIYIHLDWHVAHYVKILLDEIFGRENFRNEIIWWYLWGGRGKSKWNDKHDTLLFYSKSDKWTFNHLEVLDDHKLMSESSKERVKHEGALVHHRKNKKSEIPADKVLPSDTWYIATINAMAAERLNFPTQKPEDLLKRIIKASSNKGDVVADFFCGSGTTAAVAEKLGRRWITSDLSKFAVHTTRKRLLDLHNYSQNYDKPCRPFEVQNLGSYQKYKFVENGNPPVEEYRNFILKLYEAKSVEGYAFVHGRKGDNFVHIAGVDSVVTKEELEDAAQECANEVGGQVLDVLGWDYELGLDKAVEDVEDVYGIEINLKLIPKEATELKEASEADEEIKFFDMSHMEVDHEIKGSKVEVKLKDFVLANPEFIPDNVREKLHKEGEFTDYIDYWAVDFDYQEDTFHNMWQTFRTEQDSELDTTTSHSYDDEGKKKIFVKVIDIFGNDTNRLFEIEL
ncbi:MAG: site-specific DNA-methyltransferase [Elusimicrobiota bacterium]